MTTTFDIPGVAGTQLERVSTSIKSPVMRGIDFYGPELETIYSNAVRNFRQFHGRAPDPVNFPLASDHLFFSKFYRYLPIKPNPASKLNAVEYLDKDRFGDKIYVPKRLFVGDYPRLPKDRRAVVGMWCKLDLGNSLHVRISSSDTKRRTPRCLKKMRKRINHQYGREWGEWWYSISDQKVFFEEDLSERMTGHEYQFHINGGQCRIVKKKLVIRDDVGNVVGRKDFFFDNDFNYVPGSNLVNTELEERSFSPHIEVMKKAAIQIGQQFDYIRVDFIELQDVPCLGELSICTQNCRIRYSTVELETAMKAAVALC